MSDLAEDRLRSVEDRLTRVETRLDGLTTRIDQMDRHIAARFDDMNRHIATRFDDVHGCLNDLNTTMHTITAKLPTWWQFPAAISGVTAVGATIYGVLSYLHLHGSI